MAWIFTSDGNYVNFNGGGNLWRLHKDSACITWHWDQTGDLFFDVYGQEYTVKAANIADVVINGTPLSAASGFPAAIQAVFTGLYAPGGGGVESVTAGTGISVTGTATDPIINATGGLLSATVELTDAQIKALPTTGIEIIAAPGANKIINPSLAIASFNRTADYTNITASGFINIIESGLNNLLLSNLSEARDSGISNFLAGGADTIAFFSQPSALNNGEITSIVYQTDVNKSLVIKATNTGDYTGGNAANTMKITVWYVIIDLS